MAKPSATKSESNVTRIKASDSTAPKAERQPTKSAPEKVKQDKKPKKTETSDTSAKEPRRNVFVRMGRYFKGAWQELRLVRWPTRKATWGMTGALIVFTLFFVVVILLLDYGFSQLFKLILGSN